MSAISPSPYTYSHSHKYPEGNWSISETTRDLSHATKATHRRRPRAMAPTQAAQSSSSPSSSEFQFITSINTVARDDETRRKVRSHARRQKLPNGPSQPPRGAKKSGSQKDHVSKFRLKPSSGGKDGAVAPSRQERKLKKTNWLAVSVARELPNFTLLHIEKTPLTENLLKYCMAVCLSPQEDAVERWFDRAGAPTYLNTCKSNLHS